MHQGSRAGIVVLLAAMCLVAGCQEGNGSPTTASAASASSPTPANTPPTISGAPITAIRQGEIYDFRPQAMDPDGDTLVFSIRNMPGWASFEPATGRLRGTPAAQDAGTYENIGISVSDGRASAQLAAFAITVNQLSLGSVTLSWTPPLTNSDGSALTTLAGYRIYYGQSANALTQVITIDNAGATRWVVSNLSPATYYFSMTSYTTAGIESAQTEAVSRAVS